MKRLVKEKIKSDKNQIIFLCILVFTFLIFIPFLAGHYASDTYNIANVGYEKYAKEWSLKDGRLFMALIVMLAGKINLKIEYFVGITLVLALIVSCISVMETKKIIEKLKKPRNAIGEIIITLISYVTIFNFMYIDDMYFVECFVMAISILLFIIAAKKLVFNEKNNIIKALILVTLGVICYQGTISVFLIYVFLITLLKNNNNWKQIAIDLLNGILISLFAAIVNILIVKIVGKIIGINQTRLDSFKDIWFNMYVILMFTGYDILVNTCGLFPKYLFLIFCAIVILISSFYISKYKDDKNKILEMILIFLVCVIGSSLIYVFAMTSFIAGRLRFGVGAIIGMFFIYLYVNTNMFEDKKIYGKLIITTLIIYFIVNISNYIYLMLQHKYVNKLEKQDIMEINTYVSQYEEETGIKIVNYAKVAVGGRGDEIYYPQVKNKSTFTNTAVRSNLFSDGAFNSYTGRNLKTLDVNIKNIEPELLEYLKNSEKGYLCKGNTLYVNVYSY